MKNTNKCLTVAIMSTLAAAMWLANTVIEYTCGLTICGADSSSLILTAVWTFSALCWWLMWHKERKTVQE